MNNAVAILISLGFVGGLLDAMWSDVRVLRIPNRVPSLLLVAFIPAAVAKGFTLEDWVDHTVIAVILFGVGAAMFTFGLLAGGAAKLVPAVGLWIDVADLPRFIEIVTVAGGLLGLAALLARLTYLVPWSAVRQWGDRVVASGTVPYGLAIAAGGLDWWSQTVLS